MQDLVYAIRSLRKQLGFTVLALVTLSLGIGATTVAFAVLDTVLLRPLPYRQSDRLVYMQEETDKHTVRPPSFPNFADWRAQSRSLDGVASAMYPFSETVLAVSEPVRAVVMGLSQNFLDVLGARSFLGREFTPKEGQAGGPPAAMVSYGFWQGEMRGREPLGRIRMGEDLVPVVGVLPPGFHFMQDADVFLAHERFPGTMRSAHNYMVIGRIADDQTIDTVRAEMRTISARLRAQYGRETEAIDVRITPLREYLVGDYQTILTVVFGAATLVLLIACTNLISAQLARGLSRERDIAVRAALGASRPRLVRQLLMESAVIAAGAAGLGTGFAMTLTRVVRLVGTGLVPRLDELSVSGRILGFSGVLAVATLTLIGLYPAFRLSVTSPGDALRGASRGTHVSRRSPAWPFLAAFEIAMAVVLLIGSGLLIRTMRNILNADTGFQPQGMLTAALSPEQIGLTEIDRLREELGSLPGVQGTAFVNRYPLSWGNESGPVLRPSDPRDKWPALAGFRVISSDYFVVMRQRLVMGRAFTDADRAGSPNVAIITDGLARTLWPGEDPIGKPVRTNYLSTEWQTVVGVVAEASSWTMARGAQHEIFVPLAQHVNNVQSQLIAVIRTAGDPHSAMDSVRARLHSVVPNMPAKLATLEDRIAQSAADRNFAMIALGIFGGIALVLAGIGIFGVMSYTVATQTHEMGVRLALGATPAGLRWQVLRNTSVMALAGIVAGLMAGSFATHYLHSVLYGVNPFDPATYAAGSVVLFVTAIVGAYIPAHRSSRIDPLIAIRSE
jgi:putative ABC transport system permease protein